MRKRPLSLLIYSGLLLAMALSMPVQAIYSFDLMWSDFSLITKYFTWLNIATALALVTSSLLAFYASKWLMYVAPITIIVVLLNNAWVGYVGLNFSMWQATVSSVLFICVNFILLEPDARAVLRNQKIHWWRADSRRRVSLPVSVHPWVGDSLTAITHDISVSGAFITCKNKLNYSVGDRMQLRLSIEGYKDIRCTARLVRKTDGVGSYPAGFGIQFEDLSRFQKQFIENIVEAPLS